MMTKQVTDENIIYTGNDGLYPTEITFSNGWKVRLACSEDGQKFLIVEPG